MKTLKCLIFLLTFVAGNALAAVAFVGMENSKYAIAGFRPGRSAGIALMHSLWVQDASQYVRLSPFYYFHLNDNLSGQYSVFYGTTYEQTYYDYGADLFLRALFFNRLIELDGRFRPQYDSDLKFNYGYEFVGKISGWRDIAVFGGIKNIPEFRKAEGRFLAGMSFSVKNLSVSPEITIPTNLKTQYTRVHVNFLYELSF
jgi:hypothetical protein